MYILSYLLFRNNLYVQRLMYAESEYTLNGRLVDIIFFNEVFFIKF